jgi:phosphatidate phosphatase PAH1
VVIRQPDGSLKSSPFHVRFGKLKLLHARDSAVEISVNGQASEEVAMILGDAGEAFFVRHELIQSVRSELSPDIDQTSDQKGAKSAHNLVLEDLVEKPSGAKSHKEPQGPQQ